MIKVLVVIVFLTMVAGLIGLFAIALYLFRNPNMMHVELGTK